LRAFESREETRRRFSVLDSAILLGGRCALARPLLSCSMMNRSKLGIETNRFHVSSKVESSSEKFARVANECLAGHAIPLRRRIGRRGMACDSAIWCSGINKKEDEEEEEAAEEEEEKEERR